MSITPDQWQRLSSELTLSVPAAESQISAMEVALGTGLPSEYREFLAKTNGAEGGVGSNAYVILWPVEELKGMNEAYEVERYAPGFLIFGSNGGGEAFAFDIESEKKVISALPFVGMSRSLAQVVGRDFWGFLEGLWQS